MPYGFNDGDSTFIKAPNTSGLYAALSVGTAAAQVKVGGSVLAARRYVILQPKANAVYWGFSSAVTTSTGFQIFKDQTLFIEVGDGIDIYLIADGSGRDVRIGELS